MGLICALGFTRCEASAEDPSPHIESAAVAHVLRRGPRSPALRAPVRTTDASIAVSNLSAQLHGLSFALSSEPGDPTLTRAVVDLRLVRTQFLGLTSDYEALLAEAEAAIAANPGSAAVYVLRSRVAGALHHFRDAIADLEHAKALAGADADAADIGRRIESARIAVGEGDREGALVEANALVARRPDYASYSERAAALVNLGRYHEADRAFAAAAAAYQDVSPFALAWVDFQRGLMWAESADEPQRALPFYEAAVARLPQYVVANVHLAEILEANGELERATMLLAKVAPTSLDPEPSGLLGELLASSSELRDRARGRELIALATARYDELLELYPLAFSDHGAEFFAGPGRDLPRALALAELNLENRRTPRAYGVAIEVALRAGALPKACAFADAARRGHMTPKLEAILETTQVPCGAR